MKLIRARITNYKSITDSGWFSLDDCTCLVGKNESGKTAVLQALARTNPATQDLRPFDHRLDYPRRLSARYKKKHKDHPDKVTELEYELDQEETQHIATLCGEDTLGSPVFRVSCDYSNTWSWDINYDPKAWLHHAISQLEIPDVIRNELIQMQTQEEAVDLMTTMLENETTRNSNLIDFRDLLMSSDDVAFMTLTKAITLPTFFYFDEYSTLQGEIGLMALQHRVRTDTLTGSDTTALSLLELAETTPDAFMNTDDYEVLKADLESASAQLSDDVFTYWSQNRDLAVEFDQDIDHDVNRQIKEVMLKIRIKNHRHRVTVAFDERSKGFVWFFSFLAAFDSYREKKRQVILLLDEPGLNLHAKAQEDLLRFMRERLETQHQIIYSTHSPFMIDSRRLENVRIVEDQSHESRDPEAGTIVSQDWHTGSQDTLFPLQSAIGWTMTQTLFIGPKNLLVEGPSEIMYLTIAADMLDRMALLDRWTMVPVGGADKMATFVALIRAHELDLALLVDIGKKDHQKFDALAKAQRLDTTQILRLSDFVEAKQADIEDLLDRSGYLELVNMLYEEHLGGRPIEEQELPKGNPRIVKCVEHVFATRGVQHGFSHFKPSSHLNRHPELRDRVMTQDTLERFSQLFDRLEQLER